MTSYPRAGRFLWKIDKDGNAISQNYKPEKRPLRQESARSAPGGVAKGGPMGLESVETVTDVSILGVFHAFWDALGSE